MKVELVQVVVDGVNVLIDMEKELEKGHNIDHLKLSQDRSNT